MIFVSKIWSSTRKVGFLPTRAFFTNEKLLIASANAVNLPAKSGSLSAISKSLPAKRI
jgi:hypothetical protein